MKRTTRVLAGFVLAVLLTAQTMQANHSWGNYHWARSANPVFLQVGDNVNGAWDTYLDGAISDWRQSTVIDLEKVAGTANPRNCRPTDGRIEVCSARYGQNGWLGLAQIWASGSHITQAVTKVNDSYFELPQYNTPAWRRMVMCQEVGHDFGLDHQDETFDNANLGTCMDYTNDPDGGPGGASNNDPSNEHPNTHDYNELVTIYSHLDSAAATQGRGQSGAPGEIPAQFERGQFGRLVRSTNGGRTELYELDLGAGRRVFSHVIWAD
jgi:hypothetical protein